MLSSSTIVAPAAIASCTCSTRSHSTSTVRPGHSARARAHRLGDAEPGEVVVLHQHELRQRPAVVHAAAGTDRRLLDRPQAGQRLAGVPDPGGRAGGVDEPTRERSPPPTGGTGSSTRVRSPVSTERSGPATSPTFVPGADHVAVVDEPAHLHRRVELREHLVAQRGAGDHAVGPRDDVDGRRRASAGTSAAVRSPSGPRSSASARRDERARRRATGASCALIGDGLAFGAPAARTRAPARSVNTNRPRNSGDGVGMVGAGVRAARLTARGRGADQRRAHREQVRALDVGRHQRARVPRRRSRGSSALRSDAGVTRHDPLQLLADRADPPSVTTVERRGQRFDDGTMARARRWLRAGRVPRHDRLDGPRREHQALEQRVRRQPVRAVHARARGLAARPQAGERRGAVEVGAHPAREVVRRGRDRQPVAASGRVRRAAGLPDRGEAPREVADARWRRATGGRGRAR